MIFRQNPLLPSNGNNAWLLIILIFNSIVACGTARRGPHSTPDVKDNGTVITTSSQSSVPIDTLKWDVTTPEDYPPITDVDEVVVEPEVRGLDSEMLSNYRISVMLPFLNNRFDRISGRPDNKSNLALHYYYGMKLAVDRLQSENVSLALSVHDTQASSTLTKSLLDRSTTQNSHLIIGPAKGENVRLVAQYAKDNGITHLSPFSASTRITSDNPFYAQVRPSLETHSDAILKHALERYRPDQIVLVCRDKPVEKRRLAHFQKSFIANSDTLKKFKEFVIRADVTEFVELDYSLYMAQNSDTTVFIVPSWSNESFVYSFLRQLRVVKGFNPVVVYGMPQWKKYERGSYDYYESLNVHVSSEDYLDKDRYDVKQFQKRFYEKYGLLPNDDAYKGYDLMLYTGRMLTEKGTHWHGKPAEESSGLLQSNFNFEAIPSESDEAKIERFENKSIWILKYEDFGFRPAG